MAIRPLLPQRTPETAGRLYTGQNGLYVSVRATAQATQILTQLIRKIGLNVGLDRQYKMHCTIMWSKALPHLMRQPLTGRKYKAKIKGLEYWSGHDAQGYVVVILDSWDLNALHEDWSDRGCSHSFADYTPHVTLADDIQLTPELKRKLDVVGAAVEGIELEFWQERLEDLKG